MSDKTTIDCACGTHDLNPACPWDPDGSVLHTENCCGTVTYFRIYPNGSRNNGRWIIVKWADEGDESQYHVEQS